MSRKPFGWYELAAIVAVGFVLLLCPLVAGYANYERHGDGRTTGGAPLALFVCGCGAVPFYLGWVAWFAVRSTRGAPRRRDLR